MVFDGEAFGAQMVEIVRGYVAAEVEPLLAANKALTERVAALEARELLLPEKGDPGQDGAPGQDGTPGRDCDMDAVARTVEAKVDEAVAAAFAAMPVPQNGQDGLPGLNGKDVDLDALAKQVDDAVQVAVAALPVAKDGLPGVDGKDADMGAVEALIEAKVSEAVASLPVPKDGKDGRDGHDPEVEVTQDGANVEFAFTVGEIRYVYELELPQGPIGKDGAPGATGKLEQVKAWVDEVHYAGSIRTHLGGTWQAAKDTAKAPPHEDWLCIAAPGANGKSLNPRRLWVADDDYFRLDVVALNGGSFVALRDDPGPCPGDGWMLMTQPGKRGEKGERGDKAERGPAGPAGPPVIGAGISEDGILTLMNADGSQVECDMYPILSKIDR